MTYVFSLMLAAQSLLTPPSVPAVSPVISPPISMPAASQKASLDLDAMPVGWEPAAPVDLSALLDYSRQVSVSA